MAYDNLLSLIAQPQVADIGGAYQQGLESSQNQQLRQTQISLANQQSRAAMLQNSSLDTLTALAMPYKDRLGFIATLKNKYKNMPNAITSLSDIENMSDAEQVEYLTKAAEAYSKAGFYERDLSGGNSDMSDAKLYATMMTADDPQAQIFGKYMHDYKRETVDESTQKARGKQQAEAEFAQEISYETDIGKYIAEEQKALDVIRAKGQITPQEKKDEAQRQISIQLWKMADNYEKLFEMGAIKSTERGSFSNAMLAIRTSKFGQTTGRIFGTMEQEKRDEINNAIPLILQEMRKASDTGTKAIDSEKELAFYLQAVSSPNQLYESSIAAIALMDMTYGDGRFANSVINNGMTTKEEVNKLRNEMNKLEVPENTTATNPTTGEKIIVKNGFWVPIK